MELGGIRHSGERVFLLSTTHGAETHSLAAAIATMRVYRDEPVVATLHRLGERLRAGVEAAAIELGITEFFQVVGRASNLVYATRDAGGERSQAFRTLFLQETIARGFLLPSLVVSYAHSEEDVDRTVEAIGGALAVYRDALEHGIEGYLRGRPVQPVFRRFN
jgi:glutamate-1-semialdehyde 2,1-aminomutase